MKKHVAKIIQDEEHPIEREVLASAIVEISNSVKRLEKSRLTREAIIILTHHNCKPLGRYKSKPGLTEIRLVLDSLGELEAQYLK